MSTGEGDDSKPLLLLVDDDEDSRFLYVHYLTAVAGFRVVEAADGRAGVGTAATESPDIVVMDLTLPVMDGWAALAALRADARTKAIPVVALTGHSIQKANESGKSGAAFDAVLVKPCLPEDLAKRCRALLAELSEKI